MERSKLIVRIAAAGVVALVAAVFVVNYTAVNAAIAERGEMMLQVPTMLVLNYAPWAYLVPLAILAAGLPLAWFKHSLAVTVLASAAWVFALGWSLFAILAWRLPYMLV